jgi:Holliday junction resolvase RusA-like endonuclease
VAGIPRPQPRPRFVRAGSKIRAVSTASDLVKIWRLRVLRAVIHAVSGSEPLSGALEVELVFTFAPPRTAEGRSRIGQPHTQRPDADNLAKLVLDVMQAGRAFADDAKVARLTVVKAWGEDQGAAVTVRQLRR